MTRIQTQALRKGTEIAVYEIKEVLGSNLSEITYRVWNEHLNAMVILKEFFPSDYVERDAEDQSVREISKKDTAVFEFGLKNFIQQNEKLLGIQHSGVQSAHNVLEFNNTAYLAVDDEQGTLLSEKLKKSKSFNEEELRIALTCLLNAVQNIHEAGIVHGDIHPDNILIRKNDEFVLINIATARQGFAGHIKMLPFELHAGYAPPEQYEKDNQPGASVDLYGLGATMYRCVTNTDPVAAKQRLSDLSENHSDPLKSILDHTESGFSEEFLQTISWMLEPDLKARPQSVSDVLIELNKDNKNLKAIEAITPVKMETKTGNYADTESKAGHIGMVGSLAGMIGSVAIGSALIWYLQKGEINLDTKLPEQEKQISAASVVQESDSGNSGDTPAMQSAIEPEQEKHTLSKAPKDASAKLTEKISVKQIQVKSAQQEQVASKSEVITDTPSPSKKLGETDSSSQDVPVLKPSEENQKALVEPEKKSKVITEQKVSTEEDLIKQHMARAKKKFVALELTTPSEDNAYHYYKAVLKIDPNHEAARKGLRRIVDRYILLIDSAMQREQVELAQVYLDRAKGVLPNSPYLEKKSEELAGFEQSVQDVDEDDSQNF